jgi:hypothetical protein
VKDRLSDYATHMRLSIGFSSEVLYHHAPFECPTGHWWGTAGQILVKSDNKSRQRYCRKRLIDLLYLAANCCEFLFSWLLKSRALTRRAGSIPARGTITCTSAARPASKIQRNTIGLTQWPFQLPAIANAVEPASPHNSCFWTLQPSMFR